MITIDNEARQQKSQLVDFSNFVEKYIARSQNLVVPSLTPEVVDRNIFFLVKYSKYEPFDQKYKYRPDYMSYDEYGTVCLDKLLMYVNNVFCEEEFDLDTVIIPTYDAILQLVEDRVHTHAYNELEMINW